MPVYKCVCVWRITCRCSLITWQLAAPSPWLSSLTDDQKCFICVFNLSANQKSCSSCIFDGLLMDECPSLLTDLYTNTQTSLSLILLLLFFHLTSSFSCAFILLTDCRGVFPSPPVLPPLCLSLISLTPCLSSNLKQKQMKRTNVDLKWKYWSQPSQIKFLEMGLVFVLTRNQKYCWI